MQTQNGQTLPAPGFNADGEKVLCRTGGPFADMLQNISVWRLTPGQSRQWLSQDGEMAFVLVEGAVTYAWPGRCEAARRGSFVSDGAYCLHVPRGTPVTITAQAGGPAYSEVLVQATGNPRGFDSRFYTPENCAEETFGAGQFEGKAQRRVRTFFDYHTAPYSKMVCGEIVAPQGGWSSYPPHQHPQPEVYYYRFEKPQGFGACFIGDAAYVVRDGSFAAIAGGLCHPQVSAPGYPMYYVWMIRHFDGDPWTDRIYDPAHAWLLEK